MKRVSSYTANFISKTEVVPAQEDVYTRCCNAVSGAFAGATVAFVVTYNFAGIKQSKIEGGFCMSNCFIDDSDYISFNGSQACNKGKYIQPLRWGRYRFL